MAVVTYAHPAFLCRSGASSGGLSLRPSGRVGHAGVPGAGCWTDCRLHASLDAQPPQGDMRRAPQGPCGDSPTCSARPLGQRVPVPQSDHETGPSADTSARDGGVSDCLLDRAGERPGSRAEPVADDVPASAGDVAVAAATTGVQSCDLKTPCPAEPMWWQGQSENHVFIIVLLCLSYPCPLSISLLVSLFLSNPCPFHSPSISFVCACSIQ